MIVVCSVEIDGRKGYERQRETRFMELGEEKKLRFEEIDGRKGCKRQREIRFVELGEGKKLRFAEIDGRRGCKGCAR